MTELISQEEINAHYESNKHRFDLHRTYGDPIKFEAVSRRMYRAFFEDDEGLLVVGLYSYTVPANE